jgi:hypothetical protein
MKMVATLRHSQGPGSLTERSEIQMVAVQRSTDALQVIVSMMVTQSTHRLESITMRAYFKHKGDDEIVTIAMPLR